MPTLCANPDFATFKDLFLPDGHSFFDLLNGEAASREGILSMGRRDRNHDTWLTYLHRPNTMNNGQPAKFPLLLGLPPQLGQFNQIIDYGCCGKIEKGSGPDNSNETICTEV